MNPALRDYINDTFSVIEWVSSNEVLVKCPGEAAHTSATAKRDAKLTVDHNPTVFCFHSSCKDACDLAALDLKDWAVEHDCLPEEGEITPEEKQRRKAFSAYASVAQRWQAQLPKALQHPNDTLPLNPMIGAAATLKFLYSLFDQTDRIWIGNPEHSGRDYWQHFLFPYEMSATRALLHQGNFISTSTYRDGAVRRIKEEVWERKYFVVEFDKLDPDPEENCQKSMSLICWLTQTFGETKDILNLRALVYSGSKSIHAWFDFPKDPATWDLLRNCLPALGADPAAMRATQPVRLPGAYRADKQKHQTLLYLK